MMAPIVACASVVPPATIQLIASQPITLCPWQKHAVRDAVTVQFFCRDKDTTINAQIPVLDENVSEPKQRLHDEPQLS